MPINESYLDQQTSLWQPMLVSQRLSLRPLAETDWVALRAAAKDPEIWAGHPVPDRWQRPTFRSFFDNVMSKNGAMAIFDRTSGAMIGTSTFHNHKPERSEVEIGSTFLVRSHWGGGFNRELKQLMLSYAFAHVDVVVFRIGDTNLRSRRACEKIGGRLTERAEMIDGPHGPISHLVYELNKSDFMADRNRD